MILIYQKPGFAFGGSCLPKDMRALLYKATQLDLESPLLRSVLISNNRQINMAFAIVKEARKKKIGILGLSFQHGTDTLRQNPMVELIERLIGKGYDVSIFDREVALARPFGSNKRYIEHVIPHVSSLMKPSPVDVVADAEVIVVGKKTREFANIVAGLDGGKTVVDLVRIAADTEQLKCNYEGICW